MIMQRTLGLAAAVLIVGASSTYAQTTSPNKNGVITPAIPPASDSGNNAGANGARVIQPGNPDPGMTVTPPATSTATTPDRGATVIPPPGTVGNAPNVVPK